MSVGSWMVGIGRSWMATLPGPMNTTALIVLLLLMAD